MGSEPKQRYDLQLNSQGNPPPQPHQPDINIEKITAVNQAGGCDKFTMTTD